MPLPNFHIVVAAAAAALILVGCQKGETTPPSEVSSPIAESEWDAADFVQDVSDLEMDEDILYGRLPSGVRYAVMSNDTPTQTATLLMRFDAGSLDETDETRGIAHFLEHMAFNGSDAIPEGEMIKRLERLGLAFGPDTNASTGFDQTLYQLELPEATDALLDEALMIFRETAERLTLDPDAIERERGVILAEKRARNSPAFRAQIASLDFQTEGLGLVDKLPIGTVETIQSVTAEQFRTFYEQQYQPEDTFIVLVADRPKEALVQHIETHFADWANEAESVPDSQLAEISFDEPRYGSFFDPEIFSRISLSTITDIAPEDERRDTIENRAKGLPIYFANAIINRRFARKVRNGEASFTGAGAGVSNLFESAEIASLSVSAEPDKLRPGFIEAERMLRQAFDHGFTQSELDEQIANARKRWEVAVQTAPTRRTPSLARQIMNSFASERVVTSAESSLARFDEAVEGLTLEQVEQAFRDAWDAMETAPQLYIQTDEVIENADDWLKDLLAEARSVSLPPQGDSDAGEFAYSDWGAPGAVAERREIDDIGITTVRFENGVKLNLKPTPYEEDVIRIRVTAGQGTAFYPQDKPGFGTQLSSVLGASALGAHTADELSTINAGKAVGVSRSFGTRAMTLAGSTVPNDLPRQLEMMAAGFADPAYREEVLPRYESQIRSIWSKLDSTPRGAAGLEVPSILSSGHWRDVHPTEAQMIDVDLQALSGWYRDNVSEGPIEIGVVGDFDIETMIADVARTFGALPEIKERSKALPETALDRRFPDGRQQPYIITHAGEPDTAQLSLYWPVDDHESLQTDRLIGLLSQILRLELTEVLREEEGATYSPSAFRSLPETDPDWGYVGVSIEAEPDELNRLTDVIENVAANLVANGVSEDTFDRAIKPILENIETNLENNNYWLSVIDEAQGRPETLDYHRSRNAAYTQMTAEDLSSVVTLLNPDRAIRVHVVPEK
jgi:zinc protease